MSLREMLMEEITRFNFISLSALKSLINARTVTGCLQEYQNCYKPEFVTMIVEKYSRIFALSVLEGIEREVSGHLFAQVEDENFPFLREENIPCLPTFVERQSIYRVQWKIPLVLDGTRHLDLPPEFIAPFLKKQDIAHGAFGYVSKIRVANGHLPGYDSNTPVALKRIRKLDQDKWEVMMREVETLRAREHPNIIHLLASFTERDIESNFEVMHLNLMFPYAEMDMFTWLNLEETPGHLSEICNQHQRKDYIYGTILSLCDALAYLHREKDGTITSHHDLKPRNILLFGMTWKIADFGRTHLIDLKDGSETEAQKALGTFEYNPPEYWDEAGQRANARHGRGFDIWAMGCIIIELATIAVHGWSPNRLAEFRRLRKENGFKQKAFKSSEYPQDDDSFHNNMKKVNAWMLDLRAIDGSFSIIHLLEIGARMLNEDVKERPFSWEVSLDLYELLNPNATAAERTERTLAAAQKPGPSDGTGRQSALERAVQQANLVRIKCLLDLGWLAESVGDNALSDCSDEILDILQTSKQRVRLAGLVQKTALRRALRYSNSPLQVRANVEDASRIRGSELLNVQVTTPFAPSFDLEMEPHITRFHNACREDNIWTIMNILSKFPSGFQRAKFLSSTDNVGKVPLHHAAKHSSISLLSLVTTKFAFGTTSMFYPAAIVRWQDSSGRTPLHAAAQGNNLLAIQHLLSLDVDTEVYLLMLDEDGNTAWDLATKYKYWKAAEALVPTKIGNRSHTSDVVALSVDTNS